MDLMIAQLLGFVLVITRLSAFFLIVPVFGSKSVPERIKVATIVILSIIVMLYSPTNVTFNQIKPIEAVIMLCYEASYGFCLGLVVALIFSVVRISGRIAERQMGMAMAEIMDPLTGERAQPLSMLLEMIFMLMFLSADGHHILLYIITKSFESMPIAGVPDIGVLTEAVVEASSAMLVASLRLSAPILAAFIVLMIALAILARLTPDMNILFISMPLRVGLGLLMLAIFVPFLDTFIAEFSDWMGKLLPL